MARGERSTVETHEDTGGARGVDEVYVRNRQHNNEHRCIQTKAESRDEGVLGTPWLAVDYSVQQTVIFQPFMFLRLLSIHAAS